MPVMPNLELGLSTSSSADTGANYNTPNLNVDFGERIAGAGASGGGGNSMFSGLVRDLAVAAATGLIVKWAWSRIK